MPVKMGICCGQRRLSFHSDCCYFFLQSLFRIEVLKEKGRFFRIIFKGEKCSMMSWHSEELS